MSPQSFEYLHRRVSGLEDVTDNLKALFEVLAMSAYAGEFGLQNAEDAPLLIARLGRKACKQLEAEITMLQELRDAQPKPSYITEHPVTGAATET
jgi:hypothetical protein